VLSWPGVGRAQLGFTTNNGAITITGYTGTGGTVVIPDTTNGYPVKNIGIQAFFNKTAVTSVTIPDSVTNISASAFQGCSSLTNVTIGSSVTNIGNQAFEFCSALSSVTIPDSVATLGDTVLANCTGLTNLVIGNRVTHLGTNAFAACIRLASLNIPKGVTSIYMGDNGAFLNCHSLAQFSVDASNHSFSSLDGVLFDKNQNTLIAFPQARGGTYAILNSVIKIGDSAFDSCTNLTQVMIPNSVTAIGSQAFHSCFNFTDMTIPGSVTNIGQYAFSNIKNSFHQAYFQGNAPTIEGGAGSNNSTVFAGETGTAYYTPGTTGWGTSFGGWAARAGTYQPQPQIFWNNLVGQDNVFRLPVSWATNATVVVESSTDLLSWVSVTTLKLVNGTNNFSDPAWTNYPRQFYRVRFP